MKKLLFAVALLLMASPLYALVCTSDLNGDGQIDPVTEKWSCLNTSPPLCPWNMTNCPLTAYTATGSAAIAPTTVSGKSGFSGIASSGSNALDFNGWSCVPGSCSESYAGRIVFPQGTVSGSVRAGKISRITGNGQRLDIYGCSGTGCTESLIGSITVESATFSGTAAAENGFISVSGSGTSLAFTGRTCGSAGCSTVAAGTIFLLGSAASCPYGPQYSCADVNGIPKCSSIPCFDETAGGRVDNDRKICAKDLNGDGNIDFSTEVANCISIEDGDLCPLEAVNCKEATSPAICPTDGTNCPSGGTYNAGLKRCEAHEPCPAGYSMAKDACIAQPEGGVTSLLNEANHLCESNAVNTCPAGFAYSDNSDTCTEAVVCPEGGALSESLNLCLFTIDTSGCPAGFTYDSNAAACLKDVACDSGGTYNHLRGVCEVGYVPSCPANYTYNPNTNVCESFPVCNNGSLDRTIGQCRANALPQCPPGYNLNDARDRCEATPPCPGGSVYSSSADLCTAPPVHSCPSGGIYNAATGLCELSITLSCSSGFLADTNNNVCYAAATCPSAQLNTSSNKCEGTVTFSCPAGYTYSTARSQCEVSPQCGLSGSYNASRDRCESPAIGVNCPTGYSWYVPWGVCISSPACNAGGAYSASRDACIESASYNYSCPVGGTYADWDTCNANCIETSGPYYCTVIGGWGSYIPGCPTLASFGCGGSINQCNASCPPISLAYWTSASDCPGGVSLNLWGYAIANIDPNLSLWNYVYYYYTTASRACNGPNYYCPGASWTFSGSYCYYAPSCPAGGYLDGTHDTCTAPGLPVCPVGYIYDGVLDVCYAAAACAAGGALNGAMDMCSAVPGISCQSGYTYNATRGVCQADPQCPPGSAYQALHHRCEQTLQANCPAGYTYDAGRGICASPAANMCGITGFTYNAGLQQCVQPVSCPSGGTLNGASDRCVLPMTNPPCPSGMTYNTAAGACLANPACGEGGTFDVASNMCRHGYVTDCPAPYAYSSATGTCVVTPLCDPGSVLDTGSGKCKIPGASLCPAGYVFKQEEDRCELTPPCPLGASYSASLHECTADPTRNCPTPDYAYDPENRMCKAQPLCFAGNFDPATNMCRGGYTDCPLGSRYACLPNPTTGMNQCSDIECFFLASKPTEKTNPDMSSYQNDGTFDQATGNCEGSIYIFNGKGKECRTAGISTSFFNCCSTDPGSFLFIRNNCGSEEAETVQQVDAGMCRYIGDYCKEKWPLIGCVQRANTYCCFNSKLGRIIHEQGRLQLQQFGASGNWGSPENPNCRGLTPEEFQMLDFSQIDLSEYFGDIRTKAVQEIQQKMEGKVREYYQNVR